MNKNKFLKLFYVIVLSVCIAFTISNVYATEIVDVSDALANEAKIESSDEGGSPLISFYADNAISGNLINDKAAAAQVYLQKNGKNYTYTAHTGNYIRIYRYCYETNQYERVHYESAYSVLGTKVEGNIIYFYMWKDTYNSMTVKAYDTITETFVSTVTLPVNENQFKSGFGVDTNQNYYLGLNGSDASQLSLASFDKNGNKIDQITFNVGSYVNFDFFNTNKDNTVLFFSGRVKSGNSLWYNDFLVKMNNGKFGNGLYCIRQKCGMDYRFLNDERTIAYDQYGEILQIDYNSSEAKSGVKVKVLKTVNPDVQRFRTYTSGVNDGTFVYIGSTTGMLYKYNFRTNLIDKHIDLGSDKYITFACSNGRGQVLVEYKAGGKFYTIVLNESEFVGSLKNVLLSSDHIALSHTKAQIKEMYEKATIKVTNGEYYQVKPNIVATYKAGSLKEEVLTDILNQLNYFRWLAGLNGVEINRTYLEQSQKGAVLLAASNFAHAPAKPSDMSQDFYNAALAATNCGFGFSANISSGSKPANAVKGYLDDVNNLYPNVGHRLSLLDCMATHASFGYAGRTGVINMFRGTTSNNDVYYSWPACGYFPINAMSPEAMWSVSINSSKYEVTAEAEITLRANGKEYVLSSGDIYVERAYNAYYYRIPDELKNYLTNGTKTFVDGKNVEVEFKGIADKMGNTYMIRYPVRFFSLDNTKEGILFEESKLNLVKGSNKLVPLKYESGERVTGNIAFEISNPDVITINPDGSFTAHGIGKVTVTAIVDGISTTCEIEVSDVLKGDLNKDGKVNADDVTALIDIFKARTPTEEELKIADMDGNGKLNADDAARLVDTFKNN